MFTSRKKYCSFLCVFLLSSSPKPSPSDVSPLHLEFKTVIKKKNVPSSPSGFALTRAAAPSLRTEPLILVPACSVPPRLSISRARQQQCPINSPLFGADYSRSGLFGPLGSLLAPHHPPHQPPPTPALIIGASIHPQARKERKVCRTPTHKDGLMTSRFYLAGRGRRTLPQVRSSCLCLFPIPVGNPEFAILVPERTRAAANTRPGFLPGGLSHQPVMSVQPAGGVALYNAECVTGSWCDGISNKYNYIVFIYLRGREQVPVHEEKRGNTSRGER